MIYSEKQYKELEEKYKKLKQENEIKECICQLKIEPYYN